VLAAIAIPNFITYQAPVARSESFTNLSALARAQKAFRPSATVNDTSTSARPRCTAISARTRCRGTAMPRRVRELGWAPEGRVFIRGLHQHVAVDARKQL
jgi:hypothetical protein